MQSAAGLGDEVGAQCRRRVERDVDAEAGADGHVDAEFLLEFAGECGFIGLAGRDLAAGQFPEAGEFGWPGALGDQ